MSLAIIVAMDQNQLIGDKNKIPWQLPADLKYFKKTTTGSPVIMGRKTFESIGFPLPERENIILTRDKNYTAEGCEIINSPAEILTRFTDQAQQAFIIGGAEIYRIFLLQTDKLYLTIIENKFSGDTYFPEINWQNWTLVSKEQGIKNSQNPYQYFFHIYQRKTKAIGSELK